MRILTTPSLLTLILALAACGGGGGGGGAMTPDPGAGATMPTVLASGATFHPEESTTFQATGFAVGTLIADAVNLYWGEFDDAGGVTGGRIRAVPQAGGTAVSLATGLGGVNGIATDGVHVYFAEFDLNSGMGAIRRVPVGGGAVETVAAGIFFPTGPAVDGASVYWSDHQMAGTINRAPKGGGAVTPLFTGLSGGSTLSIVVDATHLYFSDAGGTVRRIPIAGGSATTIASGFSDPYGLQRAGARLYATDAVVPRLNVFMNAAGGTPTQVENDGGTNITADGTHHYWTRNDVQVGTRIFRQPQAGGPEEQLGFGGNLGVLNCLVAVGGTLFMLDLGAPGSTGEGRILRL